jgi:mono/diheme cytochrome c family protein
VLSFSFLILAMARSFLGLGVLRFLTVHSLGVSVLCVVICGNAALAQSKESSPAGPDKAKASYQQLCQRCHAADGKGDRDTPSVPDFTRRAWQAEKSNAQLIVSILDGRGSSMPAFRGRLDQAEAKDLVAHVRAFANGATKRSSSPKNSKDFETQVQKLQIEYEGLKKQLEELKPEMPPEKRSQKSTEKEGSEDRTKDAFREAAPLFRRHCQRCHGADGKGIAGKLDSPEPPDFTRRTWQEERSNARMLKSILDGRKKGMPAFHDDLTEDQARDLVDYVRAFLPPRSANSTKPRPGAQ